MQNKILQFLSKYLGSYHQTTGDNHAFYCPKCKHQKRKLEVHIGTSNWHCWVCDRGGKSIHSLLKWTGSPSESHGEYDELVTGSRRRYTPKLPGNSRDRLTLPSEFIPLWEGDMSGFYKRAALQYLHRRGLTMVDIFTYRIGYCMGGDYDRMIVIPSYGSNGKLNYYLARDFMDIHQLPFKNPPTTKDVIGFELMMNWWSRVIIVESAFDAITIRHNCIPLFGKSIQSKVNSVLLQYRPEVVICLDGDATRQAYMYGRYYLAHGMTVRVVEIPDGEDPSSIGRDSMWDMIESTEVLTSHRLLQENVKMKLHG